MRREYKIFFLWVLVILLAAANWRILHRNPLNNDVAWYLNVGRELLSGKHLYTDIIETNPPLVCFLSVVPVVVAEIAGVTPKAVWIVSVTLLIVFLSAFSAYLWRRTERALIFLYLLVISLVFSFAFDFGQRDHLAFVASITAIGFISARMAGMSIDTRIAIAVSVVTGLLLALKPFFLIPWLLCIIYAIRAVGWKTAARFPETYVTPGMSLLQPLLVLFVTPGYLRVARMVSELYSAYSAETWVSLLSGKLLLFALIGTALTFLYRPSPRSRTSVRLASLTAVGWILSGLLQRKGWHYHVLPAVAAFSFTAWLILLDLATSEKEGTLRRWRLVPAIAALLLVCFAGVRTIRLNWDYGGDQRHLIPVVEREAHGGNLVGLSTGMSLFPLVNETGVRFATHYNCLWPLPGLYADQIRNRATAGNAWRYRRPDQMTGAEKEMFAQIYSDLAAKPQLIIVGQAKESQGMGLLSVDLAGYFRQDSRIDDIFNHYERVPFAGEYLILRKRQDFASQ